MDEPSDANTIFLDTKFGATNAADQNQDGYDNILLESNNINNDILMFFGVSNKHCTNHKQ